MLQAELRITCVTVSLPVITQSDIKYISPALTAIFANPVPPQLNVLVFLTRGKLTFFSS